MMSADPPPRLFAAGASLIGTGILMCRAEPSGDGVLIGLLCLGLWALGTLAARPLQLTKTAPAGWARRAPVCPMVLDAVAIEAPRARPELLPAPRATVRAPVPAGAAQLPEVLTH